MSQTSEMLTTLKRYLRTKGVTYRMLAEEMSLSETSIKRLFSQESFSLKRLEEACHILDLELYDLALMAKRWSRHTENRLTNEQEEALAHDQRLLTFFYFLVNGWPLGYITAEYRFSENDVLQLLMCLDRLRLIELHSENRFRLLVSKNIFWRKNGPLWKLYQQRAMDDFLNHPFDLPTHRLDFNPGVLSEASLKIIVKKIDALRQQFNDLAEMDAALPVKGRYSTALFIGFRPWIFSMIAELRRDKKKG